MKQYPAIPRIENAPDGLLNTGHLWILEKVDGAHIRFQLLPSGRLKFGDRHRMYADAESVPEPYQHAVRHVQEQLDRHALRQAVENVEQVVFFGEAMHRQTIDYDWERTPSFLGFDIWSATDEQFRPPGAVEQIYDRLGLQPVNVFEREHRTRDFDPDSYSIPDSAWYDGPAEGVVIRNKRGQRAKLLNPTVQEMDNEDVDERVPIGTSASDLANKYATHHRFEKTISKLTDSGQPVTFQRLYDRVLEDIMREEHMHLYESGRSVSMSEFRSAVAARTRDVLEDSHGGEADGH